MALTVFETAEQRLPCHVVEHADGGGSKVVAAEQAVPLQETDGGGNDANNDDGQRRPERDDVWNMIQSQVQTKPAARQQAAYVHAPVRRSSSLLTQKSLEICTESLGSETGSDGFSDADGAGSDRSSPESDDDASEEVAARATPARAFPPPLPSLARRTVASTLQMRQHRRDGRLVVEAVPVLSNTLFRAQRRGGRLLLCFADTAAPASDEEKNHGQEPEHEQQADEQTQEEVEEEEEDDDEEELEVVDRGTVVEVKVVSTQPQAHSSGSRVHRSSLVINKFVGAEPVNTCEINDAAAAAAAAAPQKLPSSPGGGSTTTGTEAVALAAASALSAAQAQLPEGYDGTSVGKPSEGKLLMTTRRRRSKQELLNHMRRCGQLSGQLFIWEPRVATSS